MTTELEEIKNFIEKQQQLREELENIHDRYPHNEYLLRASNLIANSLVELDRAENKAL